MFVIENPRFSKLWDLVEMIELAKDDQVDSLYYEHCRYGEKYKKPQTLLTNGASVLKSVGKRCNHETAHSVTLGNGAVAKDAAAYPIPLCEAIARALLNKFLHPE